MGPFINHTEGNLKAVFISKERVWIRGFHYDITKEDEGYSDLKEVEIGVDQLE